MRRKEFGTGALPPAEFKWQIGTTVASVDFVREAEDYIGAMQDSIKNVQDKYEECAKLDADLLMEEQNERITKLQEAVERIKKHEWILKDSLSIKDFLDGKTA